MDMARTSKPLLAALTLLILSACGGTAQQPITELVQSVDVKTGWFDAGVENGMNKLVPTVMLTLKNVSREPVANVQLNAVDPTRWRNRGMGRRVHEGDRHRGHPARRRVRNPSCCDRTSATLASNRARRC